MASKPFGAYEIAYQSIMDSCVRVRGRNNFNFLYIKERDAIDKIVCTPGQNYSEGTTIQDVLNRMENWKWIAIVKPAGLEDRIIIPLMEIKRKWKEKKK